MNLDCQGVRLLGLGLGDVNAQYAILGFGTNAVGLDAVRQYETTGESTVHAFDTNCVLDLVFAFQFTFAADGDDAVRDSDFHVFLLDVRKLDLDEIFILAFADVGERHPGPRRGFISSDHVIGHVERRKSAQRILYFAKWFRTQHDHTGILLQWKQQPTTRQPTTRRSSMALPRQWDRTVCTMHRLDVHQLRRE